MCDIGPLIYCEEIRNDVSDKRGNMAFIQDWKKRGQVEVDLRQICYHGRHMFTV